MADHYLSDDVMRQAREAAQGVTAQLASEQPMAPSIEEIPDWRDAGAMSELQEKKREQALEHDVALLEDTFETDNPGAGSIDAMSDEDLERALEAAHMIKDAVESRSLKQTDINEAEVTGYSGVTPSPFTSPDMTQPAQPEPSPEME